MPQVVVIGAGAGGIFAAWRAAQMGAEVLLLEKTPRIGTKILISGGGKCNVAHDGPIEDVLRAFSKPEAVFLRPSCYRLTNERIMRLFTDRGLELYTRPDGRVFPTEATAKDVVAILIDYLRETGVAIRLNAPVEEIAMSNGSVVGVRIGTTNTQGASMPTAGGYGAKALLREALTIRGASSAHADDSDFIECRQVILATGGSSYPNSGTTGDGWPWARKLGHTVNKIRPALAPIYLQEPLTELSGVAVRDARLVARADGREFARADGDLLLTHKGISGPACLRISKAVAEKMETSPAELEVDFARDRQFEDLVEEIRTQAGRSPRQKVATYLEGFAAESLVPGICEAALFEPAVIFANFDQRATNRLAATLKRWPLGQVKAVPLEKGEVVAGGIALNEVDSKTMRSDRAAGLYLCGEVLDVAGPVGGYNLQAAFATGYVAGETAARDAMAGV